MITSKMKSPSFEYPDLSGMLRALLNRLIEMNDPYAWLHVDGRTDKGWAHDVLFGKSPWLEVAYRDQQTVELNLGVKPGTDIPTLPVSWKWAEKTMLKVPTIEREELVRWMMAFFLTKAGSPTACRLEGYIEG